MGFITNNERYNQIIDIWTRASSQLTNNLMNQISTDDQGFNSIFMMLDSGARGSKEKIKQLGGMRGLMAKPRKSGSKGGEIIENPILANFKEGLSVLEYFISTHGARKGLADTALKTADAGYLTRRLVDVAQDVVINDEDCGTLRGIEIIALKENEDLIQSLYDRIVGRTSLHDIYDSISDELIVEAGIEINEVLAEKIEASAIDRVEIRSVLTCESRKGVCVKCYGRNLATNLTAQRGDAVGIIAAQSIGEPGTQLTLRTFHTGGTASTGATESQHIAKFDGVIEFESLRTVNVKDDSGASKVVVLGRTGEINILDAENGRQLISYNIPYGSDLFIKDGQKIKKGDSICTWDPFNALIMSDFNGVVEYEGILEGVTFREESDEQTGHVEKVVIESRDKTKIPTLLILDKKGGEVLKSYNLPVGAHISVNSSEAVKQAKIIAKIPRVLGKVRDITGGLPRVTELFEARNPSNPAVVSEIDGVCSFGNIKRGNREIIIESKDGTTKKYMVSLTKHILVQDGDFVKAGTQLSDGAITPNDILNIEGPYAVQKYIVNEVQEVYRLQGVKISDKHIEVIVRQMMRKVNIEDSGDTIFLENTPVNKFDFIKVNDDIFDKKVVTEAGDSTNLKVGQLISLRQLREENSILRRSDRQLVDVRDAIPATSKPLLQGITKASLGTKSWISAASFQETTKVLSLASIEAKRDYLEGLKENVIVGHKIPAGTGMPYLEDLIVGSREEYDRLNAPEEKVEAPQDVSDVIL